MRRLSDEHVMQVARDFAASPLAESWGLFGRAIRQAILDSVIISQMRIADSVESDIKYTAADIVAFRQRLASTLAAGVVPTGRRHHKGVIHRGSMKRRRSRSSLSMFQVAHPRHRSFWAGKGVASPPVAKRSTIGTIVCVVWIAVVARFLLRLYLHV